MGETTVDLRACHVDGCTATSGPPAPRSPYRAEVDSCMLCGKMTCRVHTTHGHCVDCERVLTAHFTMLFEIKGLVEALPGDPNDIAAFLASAGAAGYPDHSTQNPLAVYLSRETGRKLLIDRDVVYCEGDDSIDVYLPRGCALFLAHYHYGFYPQLYISKFMNFGAERAPMETDLRLGDPCGKTPNDDHKRAERGRRESNRAKYRISEEARRKIAGGVSEASDTPLIGGYQVFGQDGSGGAWFAGGDLAPIALDEIAIAVGVGITRKQALALVPHYTRGGQDD